jgi:redox-sensing transcriptional repressor
VVLIGVGNLGTALLRYNFYRSHNIKIVAGFDQDIVKVGSDIDGIPVYAMDRLQEVIKLYDVEVAILTVPVNVAQCTIDFLVEAGIRGVLNFTPARLITPLYVRVHHIDLTVELQTLVYFLKNFPTEEEDETTLLSHS